MTSRLETLISQIQSLDRLDTQHSGEYGSVLLPSKCPTIQALLTCLSPDDSSSSNDGGNNNNYSAAQVSAAAGSVVAALSDAAKESQSDCAKRILLFYPLIEPMLTLGGLEAALCEPLVSQFSLTLDAADPIKNSLANALISSVSYAVTTFLILCNEASPTPLTPALQTLSKALDRYNKALSEKIPTTFFPTIANASSLQVLLNSPLPPSIPVFSSVTPKLHGFLHNLPSSPVMPSAQSSKPSGNSQDGGTSVLDPGNPNPVSPPTNESYTNNLLLLHLQTYKYNLSTLLLLQNSPSESLKELDTCLSLPCVDFSNLSLTETSCLRSLLCPSHSIDDNVIYDCALKRLVLLNMLVLPYSRVKDGNLWKRRYDLGRFKRHFDDSNKDAKEFQDAPVGGFDVPEAMEGQDSMEVDEQPGHPSNNKITYMSVWRKYKKEGDVRVVAELDNLNDECVGLRKMVKDSWPVKSLERLKGIYATIPVEELPEGCGYDGKVVDGHAVFEEEEVKQVDLKALTEKVDRCKEVIEERTRIVESSAEYLKRTQQQQQQKEQQK
ncbi:hypothetical protein TrVE_jg1876 [Triparma verrucosa]|uniref:Uncharacterized protein n=1 Tax=Triparma verrucosa TaxID=1606542 RepID=A0A9W7BM60_9STRA|nr:hypothetical protein TrVE_jg1876 [Triparma verrucosa]